MEKVALAWLLDSTAFVSIISSSGILCAACTMPAGSGTFHASGASGYLAAEATMSWANETSNTEPADDEPEAVLGVSALGQKHDTNPIWRGTVRLQRGELLL